MEKKKKSIVIGATSLLLVTLILLGLTYAYYRTRIVGNTNEKSVSVVSELLEVTYIDGDATLSTEGKIEPGFTATKKFTVSNTGDGTSYYSISLDNIENTFQRLDDWTYTLTKIDDLSVLASGTITNASHQILINKETLESGSREYQLKIEYANSAEDQSIDMGAKLSFRVNIGEEINTWDDATSGTLLYAIKNNQPSGTGTTTPGEEISLSTEARILETQDSFGTSYVYRGNVENNYVNFAGMCWRIVRVQGDGTIKIILESQSACEVNDTGWYIASANPTTKPGEIFGTFDHIENTTYQTGKTLNLISYGNGIQQYSSTWGNMTSMGEALKFFQTDKMSDYYEYLSATPDWCIDTNGYASKVGNKLTDEEKIPYYQGLTTLKKYWYGSYTRIDIDGTHSPTLKCDGRANNYWTDNSTMYVGTITAEEAVYAGGVSEVDNPNYYLIKNFDYIPYGGTAEDEAIGFKVFFWTLSPSVYVDGTDLVYKINANGSVRGNYVIDTRGTFRPAVVLKNNIFIEDGGNGTQTNPYVIS